ncbi:MAG: META domain-containing protein [Dehalococcoidales bacterium]|nr:META domain-containing protein [Dehalococcoidales bacterium]
MKFFKLFLAAVIFLTGIATLSACQTLNAPIEDYTWVLTSYGQAGNMKAPLEGTEITVTFDSKEKEVSGNSGCNHYSGTYTVDGLDLTIGENMAVTEMWCGDDKGEQERQYLEALQAAQSFQMDHGNLIIKCGKQTLNFKRK